MKQANQTIAAPTDETTQGEKSGRSAAGKAHTARNKAQSSGRGRARGDHNAAQEARDKRNLVTFGPAYIRKVINGVETDYGKILSHAVALGFGSATKLRKLSLESLRSMVASAVKTKAGKQVKRTTYIH